ncbi:hypothetical protein BABINDRAFT_118266 [Babjeviella inositovora NRRL Y-12698]|uniref:Sphingoid long-chain base transporter RSB1 n=1 Tax=Babjeviella inositovora NRRL Y-12698 TaxID=984486 RepID=A0A1E3QTA7_9ASCO|nr:uncharacterized protein BABINDRAFT_118266 [Babjeviella inositovora NRRL Y-12698]ODQ80936.1 hypothetical protein BABINDRAFT_118266 [Babjeviella inositovora NRRL Y-12698]
MIIAICCVLTALHYILDISVIVYDQQFSILKYICYTQIFVTSDLVTAIHLAIGVGLTYSALSGGYSTHLDTHLLVAGLAFKVCSLSVCIILWLIFLRRVFQASELVEPGYKPIFQHLSSISAMKMFPRYASVGIICIYVCAIFGVVKFAQGWIGYLMVTGPCFLVLDAGMVAITGVVISFPGAYPRIVVGCDISVKDDEWVFSVLGKDTGKIGNLAEFLPGGVPSWYLPWTCLDPYSLNCVSLFYHIA